MLKNILNLENVKSIDKKEQKSITAGNYNLNLPFGIYCGVGHPYCCNYCKRSGFSGGNLHGGNCRCFG
ncbi:hypothetical protein [uncultured Aquimarina sp.]|uniref:hypothetical protein n=1 Tax=uncultured Aquimarina sp. TaxID=575652 RepID=UPI002605B917|nr:hypothetical protein [uncultured Aquimarina sp.]